MTWPINGKAGVMIMTPTNGNSTAKEMIRVQSERVRELVEKSDYSKCPVGIGQKDVNLFMVDGIVAILKQQGRSKGETWISGLTGGSIGAIISSIVFWTGRFHGWW